MSEIGPSGDLEVTPEQTREQHAAGAIQLVDVREDHEFRAGRIAGARHLPLDRLAAEAQTLDPERPLVFYCRLGVRSEMAARAFRGAGYDAWSMAGGLMAWDERRLPLEPEGGTVAAH